MPYQDSPTEIADLFMGRRIVATSVVDSYYGATEGTLTLDDGTVLTVEANEGGCLCGAGDYFITSLATTDNVITNVEVIADMTDDDGWDESYTYRIFVYTAHEALAAVVIDGTDGNGYYGTGYWIGVREG